MLRGLIHFWRIHLAVLAGAAVATAVLTGALLVGDSVRGSLRELTLDRLGRIDSALVSQRFFGAGLFDRLSAHPDFAERFGAAAPAIVLRGSAVASAAGARASAVGIHGVDERFFALFDAQPPTFARTPGQLFPSVVINAVLARELGAAAGDTLLLRFGRHSDVPRDTLMGEKDVADVVGSQRVSVVAVVPARGWGRFGLTPSQLGAPVAFVELGQLQRALGQSGRINAILLAHREARAEPDALLREVVTLDEYGLSIASRPGCLAVESSEFVLRPHVEQAIDDAARAIGSMALPLQIYLANRIEVGPRVLPYSTVAALDPPTDGAGWASLTRTDGRPAPAIGADEILLNEWAAADLGAAVGDVVRLEYFVVGPREELSVEHAELRVAAVVALRDLAADPTLTPDYPGIQGAEDMSSWDPPFPVDLSAIRPEDETYWDEHRATPKAFVARETGRRLWSTRYGSTTAVRVGPVPAAALEQTRERLRQAVLAELAPESVGLRFRPVKQEGLRAGVGAIDFSQYFLYFSFFLIVSAALLVGLLFRLGVEHRAREIGLRLAVGFPVRAVRRALLAEGAVLAGLGALLGLALALAYAALLMLALTTIWLPAVGSSELTLHVRPTSLIVGWVGAIAVVLASIALALRRLRRIPPPALLAGSLARPARPGGRRLAALPAWGGLALGAALLGGAAASGRLDDLALTFGSGAALLVSGLAWFALWCRSPRRRRVGGLLSASPLAAMATRNSAWNPGRSVLSVALIGAACYVVVVTGAYRHRFGSELEARDSGAGGFALVGESDVPLHQDLDSPAGREQLGFAPDEAAALERAEFFAFRLLPGEDTSCLNLYQPERPRILGVPPALVARGGFRFRTLVGLDPNDPDPWRVLDQSLEPGVVAAIGDANSMQYVLHLEPGQDLVLQDEYGRELRLRLVGVLHKSIFQSELLISERALLEHFPSRTGFSYFLVDAPFDEARELGTVLERRLEPFGFDSTTTWDKLAAYQAVEHTYLSTFQALGGLGLLLGTVGLGIVLVRNVIERRGELATLRAFGFRRSRLGWIVAAETAFLLLVGMTVGSVAALVSVAPSLIGGEVPWASLVGTLLLIGVFGMLACVVAVRGALRIPLLPALKAET